MSLAAWTIAAAAVAPAPQAFEVAAGPAVQAVSATAAQAGVDIVITAPLDGRRVPAVRGRMTVEAAFARQLGPLGARAVRIGPRMYRIEAAPAFPTRRAAPAVAEVRATARPEAVELGEVVVTAAPPVGLRDGAGHSLLDLEALTRATGLSTTEAVSALSPTVDSTRQGAGRNKLFVRGLADSAMNGPVQATVGQYFGNLRLSSGSPHPDLALVDVRRIEVFEGPQGSRFGAGSIGGVLRVTPEPPVPGEWYARFGAGVSATSGGAPGSDAALVVNLPLGDEATLRAVAWGGREGGFLDNAALGLHAPDKVDTSGGRGAVRWRAGGWTLDLHAVAQRVDGADAQTTPIRAPADRSTRVREPYASDFALAGATAAGDLGDVRVTAAVSLSRQVLEERFDATAPGDVRPVVVDRRQTAETLSSELRLESGAGGRWRWSAGAVLAAGETLVERRRRDAEAPPAVAVGADFGRRFAEAALYGEASMAPAPDWRIGLGGRLSVVRVDSELRMIEPAARAVGDRDDVAVAWTPSLSLLWEAAPSLLVFGRLDQSVRPAGVSEAGGAFERHAGDRVTLAEVGVRTRGARALSGEISAGWVDWRDIQADVVSPGGDLVTDNIGDGLIRFLSAKAAWRATDRLEISGGLFANATRLRPTRFSVIGAGITDIPNVAPLGGQMAVDWQAGRLGAWPLRLGADLRWIGSSRIGVGPGLDTRQGGYLRADLVARWGDERRAWALRLSNPHGADGVRYGMGSPYQLGDPRVVPVRPLTLRLGFETAF